MARVDFVVGDVVKLKSGGADMTVTAIAGNDVLCTWHNSYHEPHDKLYPAAALNLAKPGSVLSVPEVILSGSEISMTASDFGGGNTGSDFGGGASGADFGGGSSGPDLGGGNRGSGGRRRRRRN